MNWVLESGIEPMCLNIFFFFLLTFPISSTPFYLTNFVIIDMKERKNKKLPSSSLNASFGLKSKFEIIPYHNMLNTRLWKLKILRKKKTYMHLLYKSDPKKQFSRQYLRQPNQNSFWRLSYCFCKLIQVRSTFEYFYEESSEINFTRMSAKLSQRLKATNSLQDKCTVVGTRIKCKPCNAAWFQDLVWSPFY